MWIRRFIFDDNGSSIEKLDLAAFIPALQSSLMYAVKM